jgi:hypothetical protein
MVGTPPRLVTKYGKDVWQHHEMDGLRRSECLCLNCEKLTTCDIANALLHLTVKEHVAFAVTRCPLWEPTKKPLDE